MFSVENFIWTLKMWPVFLIAVVSLHYLVFKPTLEIIEKRNNSTTGLKDEVEEMRVENQSMLENYQNSIAEARREAALVRESLIQKARSVEKETIEEVRADNEKTLQALRTDINQAKDAAKDDLVKQSEEIAKLISNKLLS
jgi:F0F1-type ATP synthase membrane subunit b/b'